MNKMMVIISVMITFLLFNFSFSFNSQARELKEQRNQMVQENDAMARELKHKELFVQLPPLGINKAYNLLINIMRMLENYNGIKMELAFATKGEKDGLENHFTGSIFRNVKALPIDLKVNNLSKETEMTSVLNGIYILEKQTDLKINDINEDNNVLEVKGELYGI